MLNTNWLLEDARKTRRQYQELYQRVEQIEREWTSVPFHWSESQLAHVRRISEAYQAVCQYEVEWRLRQYFAFESAATESPDYADMFRCNANTYWSELSAWRDEAMYARLLVQRVERGLVAYAEYQERSRKEHAAYMERIGLLGGLTG